MLGNFLANFCDRFFYIVLDYLLVNRSVCAQRPKRQTPSLLSIIKHMCKLQERQPIHMCK
jgi:hypothetical protein